MHYPYHGNSMQISNGVSYLVSHAQYLSSSQKLILARAGQYIPRLSPADHVAESIVRAIHHPWLLAGGASSKRERRAARSRVPGSLPALAGR